MDLIVQMWFDLNAHERINVVTVLVFSILLFVIFPGRLSK